MKASGLLFRFTMLIAEMLEIQVYSPSGRIKHA